LTNDGEKETVDTERMGANDRALTRGLPVRAVLFDLDGTLVDTESHTDAAIAVVTARYGIDGFSLPHSETRGRTWAHVADTVRSRTGISVPAAELAAAMLAYWNAAVTHVTAVPGAQQAIRDAAAAKLKLAVVSSSPLAVIDFFLDRLGIGNVVRPHARIGADCISRGKPDPEGFLLAAAALEVEPAESLVFEDSRAGLQAARAAGMRSMFITCCASDIAENSALATASCTDYEALSPGFWGELAQGTLDLTNWRRF